MIIQLRDKYTNYLIYEGYMSIACIKDLQQDKDFTIIVID